MKKILSLYFLLVVSLLPRIASTNSNDTEKLKLEIEKLKLENENLKLKGSGKNQINTELDECINNHVIDRCWDYYSSEEEQKKSSYKGNIDKIKSALQPLCKAGTESPCSLVSKIKYEQGDVSSIAMMQKFITKNPDSKRQVDLFEYYLGEGNISIEKPDLAKAEAIARNCWTSVKGDYCIDFGTYIMFSNKFTDTHARKLALDLLNKGKNSPAANAERKSLLQKYQNCHLEFTDLNKPEFSSIAVRKPMTVKNLGKNPVSFNATIIASDKKNAGQQFNALFTSLKHLSPGNIQTETALFILPTKNEEQTRAFYQNNFKLNSVDLTMIGFGPGEASNVFPNRACIITTNFGK